MRRFSLFFLVLLAGGLAGLGCDTGITGAGLDNAPPTTNLAVRDTSLVDNLVEGERLSSTILVSWSGDDPDGYVTGFELRYHVEHEPAATEWIRTTRRDTLILLPIPRGERASNVVFEVRAIDNEDLRDPSPARTVFPIQNAPPTLTLSAFTQPPDTTFPVFTFGWTANDPEGEENLAAIEVAFNDSTSWTRLPADAAFATFVADVDRDDPAGITTDARVYIGRGFQSTDITVPGLRLEADNTFYVRAVDQTDTSSVFSTHTWYVRQPEGRVLFVNDYRKSNNPNVVAYHLDLLRSYLPANENVDVWDLSKPYAEGNTGNLVRSDALPPDADPTLRQTFALYDYIYWVSTNTTNSIFENNLPFAAPVLDLFLNQGGKLMVHSIVSIPANPDQNIGNPAIGLLPIENLVTLPDSIYSFLRMQRGAEVLPAGNLPGVSEPLPALATTRLISDALPYFSGGSAILPLYSAEFTYIKRPSFEQGPWREPNTVVSMTEQRNIALFGLPLVDDRNGNPLFQGVDGDPNAPVRAVHLILRSLGFPE